MRISGRSPHGERGLKYTVRDGLAQKLSRSPHGERGLKYTTIQAYGGSTQVALLMESVD